MTKDKIEDKIIELLDEIVTIKTNKNIESILEQICNDYKLDLSELKKRFIDISKKM